MTFVTADSCRMQLEKLTQLLVSTFPGSTIYQHTELNRVSHDVFTHKVDAVFLEAEMDNESGLDFMKMLHRQKPDVPVFIIAKSEDLSAKVAAAGASGYFVLSDNSEQLLDAVMFATKE